MLSVFGGTPSSRALSAQRVRLVTLALGVAAVLGVGAWPRTAWGAQELFVANYGAHSITVYSRTATGDTAPTRTLAGPATGLSGPVGLVVDTVNGELFVSNADNNSITVYNLSAGGDTPASRTIAGGFTGLNAPFGIAVDTLNNELVVANASSITVYGRAANGNEAPLRTLSGFGTGLNGPNGVIVDTVRGELLVTNNNDSLTVYNRGATGNAAPLRILAGANTGLNGPFGLALDPLHDELAIANFESVTVFPRTAGGNTAPSRTIAGGSTGLLGANGLAVDVVNNEIVVANFSNFNPDSITVYGLTSSGDAAPIRTLAGAATGLDGPSFLAITVGPALIVAKAGNGSGTVTSNDGNINCGGSCVEVVAGGTQVTLTATPAPSSNFAGWSGGGCGGVGTCTVTVTSATTVTAVFTIQTFALTVVRTGNGSGTVTSGDGNISCGPSCSETVAGGTQVTLTAFAEPASSFSGWSGGGCGGTGTCTVTVNAATTVFALFTIPGSEVVLSVTRQGSGAGTVTSGDGKINCGPTCAATYAPGGSVLLTASPADHVQFKQWGGACAPSGTNPSCGLALNASQSVTAIFSETFTDGAGPASAISGGTTVIKAVHVLELRAAIDNLRAVNGIGGFPWTDATLTVASTIVKAIHFVDLRTALAPVCAALPGRCTGYTDSPIVAGQTRVKAAHINESRANVRALE